MVTFYADEGFDETTMCVAGWLRTSDRWMSLEQQWSQRIEYECHRSMKREQQPISRFHATDCSNRRGEYRDWTVRQNPRAIEVLFPTAPFFGS